MNSNKKKDIGLKRSLSLPMLIFYGLGTTVGAGIYVLVGAAAGEAGMYAPVSFLLAALALAPTAMSYAELSGRMPVSAGEAMYVLKGFRSTRVSKMIGWAVILSGIVASATIAIGCAGYLSVFTSIPISILVAATVILMGIIAMWGIKESVIFTAVFTLIEVGGLLAIIILGMTSESFNIESLGRTIPKLGDFSVWSGIIAASLFTVFAFIGFEDMVNVAEETKDPRKTLPKAIFYTLAITTILYFAVTLVAVITISPQILSTSEAPLSLVFDELMDRDSWVIGAIAVFATANTILVQFIMVSRVIYGMAGQGTMPKKFNKVHPRTRTPILATFAVVIATLILALLFPIEALAQFTSQVILVIWLFCNLALILIKRRKEPNLEGGYMTKSWVPYIGAVLSLLLLILSFLT
ncbi:MAG: APA family basic amino acid/polyamine antiporter [Parvicellaceae bacterium]|jgi:APA family basic amino acid/polyamine antiporter